MNAAFTIGHQTACISVLVVVVLFVALQKRSDARLNTVLGASIMLLCACSLFVVAHAYDQMPASFQGPTISVAALFLTAVSSVLLVATYLYSHVAGRESIPYKMLFVSLAPYWVAGLFFTIVGDIALWSAAATISLLITFFYYQYEIDRSQTMTEHKIAQRRTVLLQEQMRPHFLFNSLATIQGLCEEDPGAAASGVGSLSGYLRKNIEGLSTVELVPFAHELEHIEDYVALSLMSSPRPYEVVYDLQVMNFLVPALTIQPLVEHAVAYGIRARKEGSMVLVSTELHGDYVRIVVEDNGESSDAGLSKQQKEHAQRILDNVKQRLEAQCAGSLHVSRSADGTRAVVLVPCKATAPSPKEERA